MSKVKIDTVSTVGLFKKAFTLLSIEEWAPTELFESKQVPIESRFSIKIRPFSLTEREVVTRIANEIKQAELAAIAKLGETAESYQQKITEYFKQKEDNTITDAFEKEVKKLFITARISAENKKAELFPEIEEAIAKQIVAVLDGSGNIIAESVTKEELDEIGLDCIKLLWSFLGEKSKLSYEEQIAL